MDAWARGCSRALRRANTSSLNSSHCELLTAVPGQSFPPSFVLCLRCDFNARPTGNCTHPLNGLTPALWCPGRAPRGLLPFSPGAASRAACATVCPCCFAQDVLLAGLSTTAPLTAVPLSLFPVYSLYAISRQRRQQTAQAHPSTGCGWDGFGTELSHKG